MKYTTETTTTHRHTTRADVLRYLKNTVFNEGIFEGSNPYDTSYIYITCVDEPDHIIVIDHCSDQETLDEFKALKVADIATIQEWWASVGCASTVEVNHEFSANGCESETVERYRHEVEEEEPETVAAFDASPIESDTLRQLVEALDAKSVETVREALTADRTTQLQTIGAQAGILEVMAEKMGGLWLWGATFIKDADTLREFCAVVIDRAERLAQCAEVEGVEIVTEAAAAVLHWVNVGKATQKNADTAAHYGVHIHTVQVLRDIETLTMEEARQKYTAQELADAQALAEREAFEEGATVRYCTVEEISEPEPATLCDSLVYVCNGQEYTINRYSDDTIESPDTGKRGHTTAQDWENLVTVLRDIMGYDVRRGAA